MDTVDEELSFGFPEAGIWNTTGHIALENMKIDAPMIWLLCSLLTAIMWTAYITFYNSRLLGIIITRVANRWFVKSAYIKIGSVALNGLAGKIMFRDFVYITYDYSVRVQDGYFIFRWWRSYVPKDVSEDLSHSDTRLSVQLNGFELHIYNRSELYDHLEKTFGLQPSFLIPTENMLSEESMKLKEHSMNMKNIYNSNRDSVKNSEAMKARTWRDLIPVIKLDICSGRFIFGNRLTPTTLSISMEEAHCTYSTKPAVCRLDNFMHFIKANVENAKVMFAPSLKYTGLVDEPPRYMGEGYVIMMSNQMDLYFYMDEPGVVPEEPVHIIMANGDKVEPPPPIWGINIKCLKGTDFSYGPWADRQRDHLFKFFFPSDWQEMTMTPIPKPGELRTFQSFDITLCVLNEATIDILFSKVKETNVMHVTVGPASYVEITLPWVNKVDGYTTKIQGQLFHVEATTSLQYRSLAEFESLEYKVSIHYPTKWNAPQDWNIALTGCKATAYIVYKHKCFFQDLIEDWACKARPDILTFVPYTCKFNILLNEFEILTLCNEYNWIDCSSANQENNHLAFCGDVFDMSFTLPFDDFLPKIITLKFWIHGEGLDLSLYVPEVSSVKPIILAIDENARLITRGGRVKNRSEVYSKKWRKICQRSAGWIDCWTVPIVALSIQYAYHPVPPLGPDPQADITTPEKEEILLSPMRIPKTRKPSAPTWSITKAKQCKKFDPSVLPPDHVIVEIEIGSSVLLCYGNVLRNFVNLKENIFGEDQNFTDMEQSNIKACNNQLTTAGNQLISKEKEVTSKAFGEIIPAEEVQKPFDARQYRPLEVVVSVIIHDIQAHIMKNCSENESPCPVVVVERLGFEMRKSYHETLLQVLVSPSYLISSDILIRHQRDKHINQGHLMLSAVQVRGHALFSNEGCPLDEDTIEYSWLVEVQLGKLSGKLTIPQLFNVAVGLETFLLLAVDPENCLKSPRTIRNCHHGVPTNQCSYTKEENKYKCPSADDIKYKMIRLAVDAIDVYLIESGTAIHAWISPIRLANCNLHGQRVKSGISGLLPSILIRLLMLNSGCSTNMTNSYNTNTTGSNRSAKLRKTDQESVKSENCNPSSQPSTQHINKSSKRNSNSFSQRRDSKEEHSRKMMRDNLTECRRPPATNWSDNNESFENWIEVGLFSLGPILLESASALPIPDHELHLVQYNFLREHDAKHKRLWFLWSNNSNLSSVGGDTSRCGCIGGCSFFGSNRNGGKFFKPSAQDTSDNYNIARYFIINNRKDYGFGESILLPGQLVFHTPPYSLHLVSLHDNNEFKGKGKLYRPTVCLNNIIKKNDVNFTKDWNTKVKLGGGGSTSTEKQEFSNSCISRENSISSKHHYPIHRQNFAEVPYARLIDSPTRKVFNQDSIESQNSNTLNIMSSPKTSISDSRLTDEINAENELEQVPTEMSHSAPLTNPLDFENDDVSKHPSQLPTNLNSMEHLPREVQRTISLTSENPSEMFFSAEEDVSNMLSQRGSVRGIQNDASSIFSGKKKFSSDLSIGHQNENISSVLNTYRSDLEINATDDTVNNKCLPKRPQSTTDVVDPRGLSSSASPSLSSNSFISAMSSQEDVALVNLQQQVNRPIIDSPLLMASYINHLSQVKCFNWSTCSFPSGLDVFSMPLFQEDDEGNLHYIGSKMLPHFDLYFSWREIKIVPRFENTATNASNSSGSTYIGAPKSHPWDPNTLMKEEHIEKGNSGSDNGEFMGLQTEGAASVSVVARFKGQVNVFLTPLMLEGLQRMIEAAIPTFSSLHLLTVVNSIHASCIAKVKNDNILKRDQSLSYWSQVHSNSKRSTTERMNLVGPGDSFLSDVYEDSIITKTQGLIVLPKISITMLQSSIVEEVISIAALDNIQDLSCVSLLTFYVEGVSTKFHLGKTTHASMHNVYIQPAVQSDNSSKKGGIIKGTRALLAHLSSQARPHNVQGEPVLIETSEKQLEELVITLDIGRAHAQLRRLNTESTAGQESPAMVTAIPEQKSKVLFECLKMNDNTTKNSIGYIMFECGLEGVAIKTVKRSHFEKSENSKEKLMEITEGGAGAGGGGGHGHPVNTAGGGKHVNENAEDVILDNSSVNAALDVASTSRAETAWRMLMKKPNTPRTRKEKLQNIFETMVNIDRTDTNENHKSPLRSVEVEDIEKNKIDKKIVPTANKETDKTSSCIVEFKSVWFNFAAPPCVPITRKIDLTHLDWNLLSTASPAITAWMNPSNRLAIKMVALLKALHARKTAVAACLMADALENEKIQRNAKIKKSRYTKNYTLLSKTLQEDPSCQLCFIMQKLVLEEGERNIEVSLKHENIPQLNTLKQGIIVLSRQWKNTLYNPILFEHQYKKKLARPINVTFSFPANEEEGDDVEFDGDADIYPQYTIGADHPEETENTLLLGTGLTTDNTLYAREAPISTATSPNPHARKAKTVSKASNSSCASIQMLPIITGLVEKPAPEIEYGALQDGSLSSSNSVNKFWLDPDNQKEDLYFWMAKHQYNRKKDSFSERENFKAIPISKMPGRTPFTRGIMQDSIKLLDAHLIFEPLLTCLGVMPQQMINKYSSADISSLENFGTNLSLIGTFDSIRVDIVVSEAGGSGGPGGSGGDKKHKSANKFPNKKSSGRPSIMLDTPLFLCERVGIELEVLKMSDGLVDHARQNVIYMSRRQLKKHTSTIINFSINIRFISQQVNMPLLRLLHQISNMYQNVKDAQNEFHEMPDVGKKSKAKDEFSLGSVSERFNHNENLSDERYDKFNEMITLTSNNERLRSSGMSSHNPLTPSPSNTKNRPQSFAQKLRSTSKTVKGKLGYTNLTESNSSPLRDSPTASFSDQHMYKMSLESKMSLNGATSVSGDYNTLTKNHCPIGLIPSHLEEIPNCWRTIYYLLELYGTMPETKTVPQRVSLTINDKKQFNRQDTRNDDDDLASTPTPLPQHKDMVVDSIVQEKTRLVIFGVAKIHKTRLLATLSGLKLEAEITTLNSTATWRKKARPVALEFSLTGQMGRGMIVLLEGGSPNQQTVVKVIVGKSQILYSSLTKRRRDRNSGFFSIGPVNIEIPQHPIALHGMMTRSSKQISSTLQELRVGRNSARNTIRTQNTDEPESPYHNTRNTSSSAVDDKEKAPTTTIYRRVTSDHSQPLPQQNGLLRPLVMQFNVLLQSLSINAALLPSLQAQYRMNQVSSTGVSGNKAKFVIDLPMHTLSFNTKIQNEVNLPSEACIALPTVHVSAEYISEYRQEEIEKVEGVVLRQGGYVNASTEIGEFDRCLTTDLLNHLVFVQKVFMREINEVLQKVYGSEKPVPLWSEDSDSGSVQESSLKHILFSVNISVKRIQLTATTPCNSAVRFETGCLELHLSNRVKNLGKGNDRKMFGKAQIDFNLSLGQLIRNVIFDEAEPEFQQYAFFHTTIGLRNAFQDELLNEDKELILLTLKRPLVYIQPIAVDKAILVWLNYKNAYEYWTEKRANLNYDSYQTPQQAAGFDRVAFEKFSNIAGPSLSTLFLQLTVEDVGICLPLNQSTSSWHGSRSYQDFEPKGAVVVTLENTIISACNSGSLVSKGRFQGLCLRFADDFETTLDDWKPNENEPIMNVCMVSEGTYEVCSRTVAAKNLENAKWLLNVKWQMEGVDIHLDVNIGKQLSSLGHTLTMLTGFEEDETNVIESLDSDEGDQNGEDIRKRKFENLPAFIFDPNIDAKKRSFMMEKEMTEQLKIINDLRTLGASHNTISNEERRLQELQAVCYKYFRRDIIQKWKRPSMRRKVKPSGRSYSFIGTKKENANPTLNDGSSGRRLDPIASNDEISSLHSSSPSCHSRSISLKTSLTHRVSFTEAMRQTSLPNANSDDDDDDDDDDDNDDDDSPKNGVENRLENNLNEPIPKEMDIDGTSVEMRRKCHYQQKQQEPNIDFELDIKVLVNSGKCVLHTKETSEERYTIFGSKDVKTHKRERSFGLDWGSPTPSRRQREKTKIRHTPFNAALLSDLTIFHIPGLDVKLHYQSKTIDNLADIYRIADSNIYLPPGISQRRLNSKRASLFAWMTLQPIQEETVISPHILEFLEQTLEPIPIKTNSNSDSETPLANAVNLDILPTNYVTYASFPVDVIVYFHMKPSTFRFSCLPVSRVECMLQLPSLDIVFSSKRSTDEEQANHMGTNLGDNITNDKDKPLQGGLSVTGCLADFNVYIFHPYGGKKTNVKEAQFSPLTDTERKDSLSINVEFVKFHITRCRKVYIEPCISYKQRNIDQSRAVIRFSTIIDIGSASFKYDMRRLTEILAFPKAWYRRRIVRRLFLGDLSVKQQTTNENGSFMNAASPASMDYSINKAPNSYMESTNSMKSPFSYRENSGLNLELPSVAYKTHQSSTLGAAPKMNILGKSSSGESASTPSSEKNQITAWETLVLFVVNFTKLNVQMNMGNVMGNVLWLTKDFQSDGRLSIGSTGYKNMTVGIYLGGSSLDAKAGIVGGNFEVNKINTRFHIKEETGIEPYHTLRLSLMALELRLDYMGTSMLMLRISSFSVAMKDEWKASFFKKANDGKTIVAHTASDIEFPKAIIFIHSDLNWDQLQIIISKSTTADLLKMYYKLEEFFTQQFKSSKRVFSSLEPRVSERHSDVKRRQQFRKKSTNITEIGTTRTNAEACHHRHWQKPLDMAAGLVVPTLVVCLPRDRNVLGGSVKLHGNNISLACFHGINFKSKSWALFSLKSPFISFTTEAYTDEKTSEVIISQTLTSCLGQTDAVQEHTHSMAIVSRITRNVVFPPQFKALNEWFHYTFANSEIDAVDRFPILENDREVAFNSIERARAAASNTSNLTKSQDRDVIFALPSLHLLFKTEHRQGPTVPTSSDEKPEVLCSFTTEFDDHIFVTVDADAFFFLHDLITSYVKEKEKVLARTTSPNLSQKQQAPSFETTQSSSQINIRVSTEGGVGIKPSIDMDKVKKSSLSVNETVLGSSTSNLNCETQSHLGHLVASELNTTNVSNQIAPEPTSQARNSSTSDLESYIRDWRRFECKTWHLEPTVRILYWAGKSIEPYGIDYILNKLGFSHARTTIPKWLQRGFMDPLDNAQALIMLQLLAMIRENKKN